ncbi:NIPSNAP family protein [Actinocrispum sp. NPDC049592]|uniref:NIPSNAP family protein n=1 Tax=Actinocrispum sp. NPDC049592 TaxID=3154835 RepID=UPI00342810C2
MSVIELRQYTLHPGGRDVLVKLFQDHLIAGQQAVGMTILGVYENLDDPDQFVWLRSFPDMAARKQALIDFYVQSAVWRDHSAAANTTMIDSDNVLLLRPVGPFQLPATPHVVATIQDTRPARTSYLETEPAENDFPRLPVRTDVPKYVWFTDDIEQQGTLRLSALL